MFSQERKKECHPLVKFKNKSDSPVLLPNRDTAVEYVDKRVKC